MRFGNFQNELMLLAKIRRPNLLPNAYQKNFRNWVLSDMFTLGNMYVSNTQNALGNLKLNNPCILVNWYIV